MLQNTAVAGLRLYVQESDLQRPAASQSGARISFRRNIDDVFPSSFRSPGSNFPRFQPTSGELCDLAELGRRPTATYRLAGTLKAAGSIAQSVRPKRRHVAAFALRCRRALTADAALRRLRHRRPAGRPDAETARPVSQQMTMMGTWYQSSASRSPRESFFDSTAPIYGVDHGATLVTPM